MVFWFWKYHSVKANVAVGWLRWKAIRWKHPYVQVVAEVGEGRYAC